VKPLDKDTILKAIESSPVVVTVEEGTIEGGFGSAVLEAANAAGVDTRNIVRCGMPDRFIEHGERNELLAEIGLSVDKLADMIRSRRAAEVPAA
jgi:1-deoxy-D-xylulose-5-phosphate synthase